MIKAEDFKWLDRVYHLFHLGSYLCLSGALTDCFLPLGPLLLGVPMGKSLLKMLCTHLWERDKCIYANDF